MFKQTTKEVAIQKEIQMLWCTRAVLQWFRLAGECSLLETQSEAHPAAPSDLQANICKLHFFTFVYSVEQTSILADISHF